MRNEKQALEPPESAALESSVVALIKQVGERIYNARKAKRFSRRVLSELSGVSQRYLVQLEAGEGNISIGLLQRLALVLDRPIDELLATDESYAAEITRLVACYQRADVTTRAQVLALLDPEQQRENKAGRVCLIGLRGAGKSTLGPLLAKALQMPFVELSAEIERNAGIPIAEIIALYGEEGYRALEADTLKEVAATHERLILAVAGGLVDESHTFAELLQRFHTVWLKADPTEHMDRVRAQGDLRPMAGYPRAMERLREILVARESLYGQAELHLDTSGKTVEVSLAELRELVLSHALAMPKPHAKAKAVISVTETKNLKTADDESAEPPARSTGAKL